MSLPKMHVRVVLADHSKEFLLHENMAKLCRNIWGCMRYRPGPFRSGCTTCCNPDLLSLCLLCPFASVISRIATSFHARYRLQLLQALITLTAFNSSSLRLRFIFLSLASLMISLSFFFSLAFLVIAFLLLPWVRFLSATSPPMG